MEVVSHELHRFSPRLGFRTFRRPWRRSSILFRVCNPFIFPFGGSCFRVKGLFSKVLSFRGLILRKMCLEVGACLSGVMKEVVSKGRQAFVSNEVTIKTAGYVFVILGLEFIEML